MQTLKGTDLALAYNQPNRFHLRLLTHDCSLENYEDEEFIVRGKEIRELIELLEEAEKIYNKGDN